MNLIKPVFILVFSLFAKLYSMAKEALTIYPGGEHDPKQEQGTLVFDVDEFRLFTNKCTKLLVDSKPLKKDYTLWIDSINIGTYHIKINYNYTSRGTLKSGFTITLDYTIIASAIGGLVSSKDESILNIIDLDRAQEIKLGKLIIKNLGYGIRERGING